MRRGTESSRAKARYRSSFVPSVEFLEAREVPGDALGLSGTALWGLGLIGPAGDLDTAGVALTRPPSDAVAAADTGNDRTAFVTTAAPVPAGAEQRPGGMVRPTDVQAVGRAVTGQGQPDLPAINDPVFFGMPASRSAPVKRKADRADSGTAVGRTGEAGGVRATAPAAGRATAQPGPLPEPPAPFFLTPNIPSAWLTSVVSVLARTPHPTPTAEVRPSVRTAQPGAGGVAAAAAPNPDPVRGPGAAATNQDRAAVPPPDGNGEQDPPDVGTLGYYSGDQQDENPPPDLPCPDCDSNMTPAQSDPNTGQTPPAKTEQPVRAFDGMPVISTADVSSKAMGFPWGQTRSWSGLNNSGLNGNGWSVDELPYLVVAGGTNGASTPGGPPGSGVMPGTTPDDRISVVVGGASAATFYVPPSGPYTTYTPWNSQTNRLTWIAAPVPVLRLTDSHGNVTEFYDVYRDASSRPVAHSLGLDQARKYGRFKSYTTADGTTQVMAAYDANGYLTAVTRSDAVTGDLEQFAYTYATVTNDLVTSAGATPPQLLAGVTLQRQDSGGNWQPVQRARYTYYTGRLPNDTGGFRNDPNGRLGDLQLVVMEDAAVAGDGSVTWQQTDAKYYRYYKLTGESNNVPSQGPTNDAGTTGGPDPLQPAGPYDPHRPSPSDLLLFSGLKTVVEGESFARLAAAVPGYQTATDAALQPYVNHFFTYERWADHVGADGGTLFGSQYYNGNNDYYWRTGYRLGSRYRATEEVAQGQGCSACSGGQGTFKYEYASSYDNTGIGFNTIEYNIWRQKTTEFLPSNNPDWGAHDRRVLYTDEVGQVMLDTYVRVNQATVAVTGMGIAGPANQATAVTVTAPNHGLNTGDVVALSGVLPQLYDGVFAVTRVDANTFRFNLPYTYYGSDGNFQAPRPYVNQTIGGQLIRTTVSKVLGQWSTYSRYDSQGRLVLQAQPSAVSGYDDTYRDLLHNVGGNYQYLNDTSGLIDTTDYYASTTATDATPGGVAGYFYRSSVQQGELGTPVVQETKTYYVHPAFTTQTVDVQVTNAGGTSATSAADQFTFGPPAAPVLTGLSPTTGSTVGGYPVTLSGSHFNGTTGVSFGNTPATFSVDSDSSVRATAPAHTAGTVTVTLTTPGGAVSSQFTYVAPPAPAVTGVVPNSGGTAGGSQVTINGANFTGATAVSFGGTPATFTVTAGNAIRATAPAHAAGVVDVTVTTPGGTSAVVAADHFTYYATPVVSGVSPNSGPTAGGTTVTLTGSGFTGASAVRFGFSTAGQVQVVNDTTLMATSPVQGAGTVDITVTGPGGTSAPSPADQFTYVAPPPTVTGLNPASGPLAGGTAVTITGTNLSGVTAVHFGATAATFFLYLDTSFTAYAPANATSGVVDVTVTTPSGTSAVTAADRFTYVAAPVVSGVSPNSGPTAGGTTVTLTGSGLTGASAVRFGFYNASQLRVVNDTTITVTAPAQVAGTVDVSVTTPGGTSATTAADHFTYVAPAPTVTGISPASGPVAGGTAVGITGTNLYGATAVSFGGTAATNFFRYSDTYVTAYAPAACAGVVDVTVTTPSGTSATSAADRFTYVAAPVVSGVSPNSGPTAGGTAVTLTGSGFTGASAVRFGFYTAGQVQVVNDTTITVVAPSEAAGTVDITVTTPGGTSASTAADHFTYAAPVPVVTGIGPASGSTAGGTSVTITGTGFSFASQVAFGTASAFFSVVSDTTIRATAPTHARGAVDITVTTAGGRSATSAADRFTFTPPAVTGLSPTTGLTLGGNTVTVTGSGFLNATRVLFGTLSATFTVTSDTSLSARAPAHAAGTVDVTVGNAGDASDATAADQFTYQPPARPVVTAVSPASGSVAGGDTVTISGSNFAAGTTTVTFGGLPAAVVNLSGNSITVRSPALPVAKAYPVAADTVYRNTDGTGAETTGYAYTWLPGTTQMQSMTVTYPTVGASQNGPGAPDTETTVYDSYGRAVWTRDGDGFLNYAAFDPSSGAVTETIKDVDTTRTGDFQNLPAGWVTPPGGGLHLITTYTVDGLGRTTGMIDPNGNVTYTVYNDANHETRTYPGWHYDAVSGGWATTGPIQVSRQYWPAAGAPAGQQTAYQETLTSSAVPTFDPNSLTPTGQETLDATNVQSLTRDLTNGAGQVIETDNYFSLAGVTYTTADARLGTASNDSGTGNYHATLFGYDERGRRDRVQEPTGTIRRNVYDGLDREVSIWVGTNDTPASGYWSPDNNTAPANMVQLTADVYDNGGVGDDNLTQSTQFPGGGAAPRVIQYFYDWRDWRVADKEGVQANEADGTHRPILYTQFDNLGAAVAREQYDGDGVAVTTTNGVPDRPPANLLRAKTTTEYDDQGRVFRTHTFSVDPNNGTVSADGLTTDTWYDHRGNVTKTAAPGGLVTKKRYDGVGRVFKSYVTDGLGDVTWADAGSVANNDVISQTETRYDANGNPILVITRNRFHDETATGELGDPATIPTARVSYVATYYDAVDRLTDQVNVGTNGGTAYQRPDTAPAGSATILVTHTDYDPAGRAANVTDPNGIVAHTEYDLLGRTTRQVENFQGDGTPTNSANRTTLTAYNGNDDVILLTAVLPASGMNPVYERTRYVYGVTQSAGGSDLFSNDLLQMVQYPDKAGGDPSTSPADQVTHTYDAAGETKTTTDRNGTTHAYTYDVLGRQTADAVTALGANVDGQVRRLATAYDGAGRPYLYTSYDAATGGNVVNQVEQVYNGLGQLTGEYQSHAGAVDPSATPEVRYVYTEMAGGVNNSRLVRMIYPNGRVLWSGYNTGAGAAGIDDRISRLSDLADDAGGTPGTVLESYAYLGLSTVVLRAHPESGVDLTYVQQPGDPTGDAGDQYTGLDRFGRVVDQRWLREADGSTTDRLQYGYDADGNALYRDNLANPQGNFGELYQYDQLNRLTSFARGTLSPTHDSIIDTPSRSQSWTLDALDNWTGVTSDGNTETRGHNRQNQITGISDAATPAYDNNGDLTATETGLGLVYDAWNRLVGVNDGGGNLLASYAYDALNHRIFTGAGGTATDLYYSSSWQVIEEREGTLVRAQNVWSSVYVDALALRDRDPAGSGTLTERLYVQQDANWNVTAVVDTSGTVQERYVYDPYGRATVLDPNSWTALGGSSFNWTYLYQGGRYDTASGLYYFRNRDYSPTLGRWVQQDPAGYVDGLNAYVALESRPTSADDPYGLKSIGQWVADLAAVTGGASKTFPIFILPLGPTNLNVDMTLSGELKQCTDKAGATHTYVQGSVTVEGYVSIGRSFKTHPPVRGTGRNTRVTDPNAPVPRFLGRPLKDPGTVKQKKVAGKRTPPQPGYRERNGYVTFTDPSQCDCPKSGLSFTGYVFVRGSIGFGVGAQFNIQQTLDRNFDPLRGWSVDGSAAWGIYGASLEAGIGGSGSYVIYLS